MRKLAVSALVLSLACSHAVRAQLLDGDGPVDRDVNVRPGVAFVPERTHIGPSTATCSLGFLVTDGHHVYATTEGHCYEVTGSHPSGGGFLDYGDRLLSNRDAAYSAVDCNQPRLCSSQKRIGKFVYVLNNAFSDPVDGGAAGQGGVNGRHNPNVPVGDFALIRLHKQVKYDPKMCLFGGPLALYTNQDTETVEARYYGNGLATSYNVAAGSVIPGWTAVAVMGPNPTIWSTEYTFLGTFNAADGGTSGGPVMSADGQALGLSGGYYLDRLDSNLRRAGEILGKTFTLLNAPLDPDAPPYGSDPACLPKDGSQLLP